ncbi:MAG: cysteine desulfurase [Candidatus Aminicenantes bacterium]|nr:MAG: cysteine desulfurase [Candidatus Aminicenantes bacterium]
MIAVMTDDLIYLDSNATTPCDPRVVEAMLPFMTRDFANPTTRNHRPGRDAATGLERARATVDRLLGGSAASEVVFTAGATEANNLALMGAAEALDGRGRHIISQATEHASVLEPLAALQRRGWEISLVGVDERGRVKLDELESTLRDDTVVVSLMLANNETGTIQPVRQAAGLAHARGALLHCDAAQGIGKIPVHVGELDVDLLTLSAHKLYGPKGVGSLWIRRRRPPIRLTPVIHGGGQENGLRSGTPNVPGAVGMARAMELAAEAGESERVRVAALRDRLEDAILGAVDGSSRNGDAANRLPNTSNFSITGVEINALLASLPDLAVNTGSACASAHPESSPVLLAMGVPDELAGSSLRLSLGRFTTEEEVDRAAARITEEVIRLRDMPTRMGRGSHR